MNILTITKRLQDSAGATGNGNVFSVSGYATAAFTVSGTFVGTITFEASNDGGTTWYALNATPINSGTAASTATAGGIYISKVAAIDLVRARVSAYTSGSITVDLRATPLYTA